jgi:3-phosphoshikimate 1-carboxyvinyltransferase
MPPSAPASLKSVRSRQCEALSGRFDAPGDKSISHRSLIFGGLANGVTEITGLLESGDVLDTANAMRALGAGVERIDTGSWTVTGRGGKLKNPGKPLDFGNSGTGVRLVMGACAGAGVSAQFVGDQSLSSRPMARITTPLGLMGAKLAANEDRLPILMEANRLSPINYAPPIASAQVKSAILLAALGASGETVVSESQATRDHTERMLALFGVDIEVIRDGGGLTARLVGPQQLSGCELAVPGDPSSVAFAVVAALITPGSNIQINGVMDNPARTGLYTTLKEMGAELTLKPGAMKAGEKTIDITARYSALSGITVPAERAASMIDEYPVLGVAAAFAHGTTHMLGLDELKAKESDRLAGTADMLRGNGVAVEVGDDSLTVHGSDGNPASGGGIVETRHDHRLAMSGFVLGLRSTHPVTIDDASMIATSYPNFFDHMASLGAPMEPV